MAAVPSFNLGKLPLAGKFGLGAFLMLGVGAAFYFIVYDDLGDKVDRARKQTGALQTEEAAQKQAQQSFFADRDELAMREQREREFNKILPADTEAAGFLSTIQQVSNVAGISLNAWQPQDEQAQSFFAKVPMKLEITGRFHQLAKFMYEIGRTDRIINVENIEMSEPKLQGDEVVLKAKCLATTFHLLKTPVVVPGGPGTPPTPAVAPGGAPK